MYKNWGNRTLFIRYNKEARKLLVHYNNPELGCECNMIHDTLVSLDYIGTWRPEDLLFLHKQFVHTFIQKYLIPKVIQNGGIFPHEKKLRAIKELIARGFKHRDDVVINLKKFGVVCHIAPLVWPKQFDSHGEAIYILNRYGIPGYTGTVLAKS